MRLSASRAVTAIATTLLAHTALGADWTTNAGLNLGSYYSTNICRASDNEQDWTVGTVTPTVDLRGDGARANLSLRAAVEYNTLAESSLTCEGGGAVNNLANRLAFVPRIDFNSDYEAIENFLFFEADAVASQNPINPFAAGGEDNVNGLGNTNVTYRWGVGARIDRQLSERWALLATYNYNEQTNSANRIISDSQEDRVGFDFGMIPTVSRFSAGIRGQSRDVTFEQSLLQPAFSNRLSRAELYAALRLSDSWSFEGIAGQEDNVFFAANDETDGTYWDVGLRWAPNQRIEISAGYGERFFGTVPRFEARYRHKRSVLTASYIQDIQFPRNIRAAAALSGNVDGAADIDTSLPGDPLQGAGDPTFVGQGPVLNERYALSYQFSARRTTLNLRARDSQQTRASDGRTGSFQDVTATLSRKLGPSLSADVRVGWRNNEANIDAVTGELTGQTREAWTAGAGLRRKLAQDLTLTLRYSYIDQQSETNRNNFEEQRVELGLRFRF